jgi:hypothetical protein
VGAASLAGRRWGPAVGGWVVALPLTSGPIAFFLALERGPAFAAGAAVGSLAGALAQAAFCLAYAALARGGHGLASLTAGSLAFAAAGAVLQGLPLPLVPLFVAVIAALGLAVRLIPRGPETAAIGPTPWWDIPARMAVATGLVLVLTGVAPLLGPRLTGLLATFPLYAAVLTVFAHRLEGVGAALAVLRGLLHGLVAFAGFFVALGALLERAGIPLAFAAALAVGLALQAGSLRLLRRCPAGARRPA